MNGDQTINFNAANCLRSETDFTETVIHNICNGTTQVVPHGSMDYVAGSFTVVLILLLIAWFIRMY